MNMPYNLVTKNAHTVRELAKYFITVEENSRIVTVSEFESMIDTARGTIQNSLKVLSEANAITLVSRGHLGTFLIHKNLSLLLNFAGITFLVGVMPLPYSKLYEGLSTGLVQTMENQLNIPVNMAHMRGARQRIEMLLNERYDFAVVSKYAALKYQEQNHNVDIIVEFDKHSYLQNHVVMFADKNNSKIEDGMRVGIDYDSIDQSSLTLEATLGKTVELVPISYNQFTDKLQANEIDVAIWNGDELPNHPEKGNTQPLNLENDDNTIAVIIIKSTRVDLKNLISQIIDVDTVMDTQRKVIDGKLMPTY